jgi:hypothetical protein
MADLPVNDAERAYLASQGLEAGPDGSWHSTVSGRAYDEGVVLGVLKAGMASGALVPPLPSPVPNPGSLGRGPLTAGHQAVAAQGLTNIPKASPAEPADFTREYLRNGHQKPSPDDHGPNNPVAPGSDGSALYAAASAAYGANRDKGMKDHLMPTGCAESQPAPPQWRPPADLGAGHVPAPITIAATKPAPGEMR